MKKLNTFLQTFFSLFLITITTSTLAINWQDDSNSLNSYDLRKSLSNGCLDKNGNMKDPSIKIIEEIPQGKRYGICHNYAISEVLGLTGKIHETFGIPGGSEWYEEFNFLEDYCEKTTTPEKGDLVIYKKEDLPDSKILHTGIVYDENLVKGKWANMKPYAVLIHPTFLLPAQWGENATYYKVIKSPDYIIEDMQKKSAVYQAKKSSRQRIDFSLVQDAEGGFNDILTDTLDKNMAGSVEATNKEQQTLLIIAAKKNNPELLKALINYGASVDKQDIHGNTALHFAAKNGSAQMMRALYAQNCNKKLKDHLGKKASDYYYDYNNLSILDYALRRMNKPSKKAQQDFLRTMNS